MGQDALRELIKGKKLGLEDVATALYLDRSTVYRRLQFSSTFELGELVRLSAVLCVPLADVLAAALE